MATPMGQDPGDDGLVFAAHNNHDARSGQPSRLRNTDYPGLYYGYFENRYGEQFVFTFDRATKTPISLGYFQAKSTTMSRPLSSNGGSVSLWSVRS